jgi:Holliday junction resolvase RusA-like endonuclease
MFVRGGRLVSLPSKPYENFRELAMYQLKKYHQTYSGPIYIDMVFNIKGKYRVDLDNLVTAILDILQDAKVIDDDNNVIHLTASKHNGADEWSTNIVINQVGDRRVTEAEIGI